MKLFGSDLATDPKFRQHPQDFQLKINVRIYVYTRYGIQNRVFSLFVFNLRHYLQIHRIQILVSFLMKCHKKDVSSLSIITPAILGFSFDKSHGNFSLNFKFTEDCEA